MSITLPRAIAVAALLAVGLPNCALALDLTGNWTGKWKCAVVQNGEKTTASNANSTAAITQSGTVLGATIDGDLTYTGIAIADAGNTNKGAIGITHCGGDDDLTQGAYTEFGAWKASTKDAKGKLAGVTVWSDDPQHVALCKYKYKRVDTTDPAVPTACP